MTKLSQCIQLVGKEKLVNNLQLLWFGSECTPEVLGRLGFCSRCCWEVMAGVGGCTGYFSQYFGQTLDRKHLKGRMVLSGSRFEGIWSILVGSSWW